MSLIVDDGDTVDRYVWWEHWSDGPDWTAEERATIEVPLRARYDACTASGLVPNAYWIVTKRRADGLPPYMARRYTWGAAILAQTPEEMAAKLTEHLRHL